MTGETVTSRLILTQIWELEFGVGVQKTNDGEVQVLSGMSRFLSPCEWVRIYLPFKVDFCHTVH